MKYTKFDFKMLGAIALAIVLLFVPTYIAIYNYYDVNRGREESLEVSTVSVMTPDGESHEFDIDGADGMGKLFGGMTETGSEVAMLPDEFSGKPFTLVIFRENGGNSTEYKFYFSTDIEKCYYTDSSGRTYKVESAKADSFIRTTYASFLFSAAERPVLTEIGGTVIQPGEMSWSYLIGVDTYQTSNQKFTDVSELEYDIGSDPGLSFSVAPDIFNIKVSNGETVLYEGAYADMKSNIKIERASILSFEISAEWTKTDGCTYYGNADYRFNVEISAPSTFCISDTNADGVAEIAYGEFVVITANNILDPAEIVFKSEPEIGFVPKFYKNGNNVFALVPISYDLYTGSSSPKSYKFTVSYGLSSKTFDVSINNSGYGFTSSYSSKVDLSSDIAEDKVKALYTASAIAEYNRLCEEICGMSNDMVFFNSFDISSASYLSRVKVGYGKTVLLTNPANADYSYRLGGVMYYGISDGTAIKALYAGKVVYSGSCALLGNFVVIDHGCGLKTWYCHLSDSSVTAGATVSKNDVIGHSGATGLIGNGKLVVRATVGGIPVSPYQLYDTDYITKINLPA